MKWSDRFYCALATLFHLAYTIAFPSIINGERYIGSSPKLLEPSYIHAFFISRIKFGEFARRPITTWLIQSLEKIGIPLEYSFLLVLYGALFIAFLLLFKLAKEVTSSTFYARLSVAMFTFTFWVIHAVFAEIYAYDEPVQYVFVFAALIYLAREKWILFSIFFLLGMMARESTVLLLPGIFFFFMLKTPIWSRENLMRLIKVGWTIPAYGLFLWLVIQGKELEEKSSSYMRDVRFKHLYYSFKELDIGIDTLTSFLMAFIVPIALIYLYRKHYNLGKSKPWVWAMLLNAGINTMITFVFTMGRETRIFAQPTLMVMPFLGMYFWEWKNSLKTANGKATLEEWIRLGSIILLFLSLAFGVSLFAYEVYWPTDTKFFNGFQHHVYVSISLVIAALLLNALYKNQSFHISKKWSVGLLLISIGFFFGNQHGYRAYDLFEPVANYVEETAIKDGKPNYLVIGTNMPNVAENYFKAQEIDALAGDFNLQLPLKQFFYRDASFRTQQQNIVYLELEPALNFPFRYILSQYGETEEIEINGSSAVFVNTSLAPRIEKHSFTIENPDVKFEPTKPNMNPIPFKVDGEYSLSFKSTLGELGIDSLYSIATRADFITDMASEAAIVITIDAPDRESTWEHVFLNVFLINPDSWNTAYKAVNLEPYTHPDTKVMFYVWNPKNDEVELKNLQVVLNSEYLPQPTKKKHVLDSRKLQ